VGRIFIIAAFTKRAQIPFSAWLPAAIAAPTPVSALVHSSTLVTAGVYLLIRFNSWVNFPCLSFSALFLGLLTRLVAGIAAIFEEDIKKVIALSTLRQLGIIVAALSLGLPLIAFGHLVAHAFFKAILFIGAGAMIHLSSDYQDLRKLRVLRGKAPVRVSGFIVANISLCGLPFIRGYYSKDACIELFRAQRRRRLG
jgi:NADH-ubiquinone oxidoreductase chain 5